jgi:hypothetical protein
VGVYGSARTDADFTGEGDRVRYEVPVPAGRVFTVEVALRYQSIGYRWARNLEPYDAPEPRRFASYYRETASGSAVVVARVAARSAP